MDRKATCAAGRRPARARDGRDRNGLAALALAGALISLRVPPAPAPLRTAATAFSPTRSNPRATWSGSSNKRRSGRRPLSFRRSRVSE